MPRFLIMCVLLSGCFTELTFGNYKLSGQGASNERAWAVGITSGVRFDYARWIRVGAGYASALQYGDVMRGHIKPRLLDQMLRADISLWNRPEHRIRASGGLEFADHGQVALHYKTGATVVGSGRASGWFGGLSAEATHLPSGVTAQVTFGVHEVDLVSDVIDDLHMIGPEMRLTYTYFPQFNVTSPGFLGGMASLFANHWTSGPATSHEGSCAYYETCYREFWGAQTCRSVKQCN